ncbi:MULTISPECIES: hypothetical protein [Nocardioides]|uniref:Anti-sigma factor n=1 Tax=Nocardioides vastitatis TaxID=2568655 RepID=A0ABW0ZKK4_9ACTN
MPEPDELSVDELDAGDGLEAALAAVSAGEADVLEERLSVL